MSEEVRAPVVSAELELLLAALFGVLLTVLFVLLFAVLLLLVLFVAGLAFELVLLTVLELELSGFFEVGFLLAELSDSTEELLLVGLELSANLFL